MRLPRGVRREGVCAGRGARRSAHCNGPALPLVQGDGRSYAIFLCTPWLQAQPVGKVSLLCRGIHP